MLSIGFIPSLLMKNPSNLHLETDPSAREVCNTQSWEVLQVEHLQNPSGQGSCHFESEHTLFMSLSSRPVHYLQSQDGKTYQGWYRQGDLLITPANTPLWVQWEGYEQCLQIRLATKFLRQVAQETFHQDCDHLQLMPTFQARSPQLEPIALMILAEAQQGPSSSQLYLDSLANILSVNLLRQHATLKPRLPMYEGGLPSRQLQQVLDYIDSHLDQNLKLETLAQLLDMSHFHFSRLFKQSTGSSPHHYLIQQRIERAKQLLKQTDQPIIDIALECGFSSHSHLTKHFRHLTGLTPKVYRAS